MPRWEPAARSLDRASAFGHIQARIIGLEGLVARLARALIDHVGQLTAQIDELTAEITTLIQRLAPALLAICGCGPLSVAKILGEPAGVEAISPKMPAPGTTAPLGRARRAEIDLYARESGPKHVGPVSCALTTEVSSSTPSNPSTQSALKHHNAVLQ